MRSLIVLVMFCTVIQAGEPDKALHEKCIYPTVMMIGINPHIGGLGTGVIIKSVKNEEVFLDEETGETTPKWDNYVMTVGHILTETPEHMVRSEDEPPTLVPAKYEYIVRVGVYKNWSELYDAEDYPCKVLHDDDEKDIALVKFTSDHEMAVAEIEADPEIYIGNQVYRMGCGIGEGFRLDVGMLTSVSKSIDRMNPALRDTYRISAPTLPGDSGGPVFHEYKVFALAVAICGVRSGPISSAPVYHIVYCVPIKRLMDCKEIVKHLDK